MQRCIQLALMGAGNVAPNPLVGAVLVCNDTIIGEGFHERFGKPHAEVNCINSVEDANAHLISGSTLYVSLEPCAHVGKTPPCVDLIIAHKIPRVAIGCSDSFDKVNGNGIAALKAAGIAVQVGVLEKECRWLNRYFFTFFEKKRPYIILKWAQTNDGFIARQDGTALKISNALTDKLVHKWRSEIAAILVGTNTARNDNPSLTTRYWNGNNPTRVIIDSTLQLNKLSKVFDTNAPTIIINKLQSGQAGNILYHKVDEQMGLVQGITTCLYENNLNAVLIEGGRKTIQYFVDAGCWDEARVITNTTMNVHGGIGAPDLKNAVPIQSENFFTDTLHIYKHQRNEFL